MPVDAAPGAPRRSKRGGAGQNGGDRALSRLLRWYLEYFGTDPSGSVSKHAWVYGLVALFGIVCAVCCLIQPIVAHCNKPPVPPPADFPFSNPNYNNDPCEYAPRRAILGMSPWEADVGRRLMFAIVLGAAVGYERRSADRPAGIRLMSLAALGSACFTICSMFCFEASTQSFDAARVAAAIPSGVGFLGSALIWKGFVDDEKQNHQVHGLTTAASVWLSAAIGVAAGGGLFFSAAYTTCLVLAILRFGPRTKQGAHSALVVSTPKQRDTVSGKQEGSSVPQAPPWGKQASRKENEPAREISQPSSAERRTMQPSLIV
mmetsp:Transcript_12653/g.34070  ORF Transcript_12653/g.34070 Transcript_12653/m.34070 type:complete len:318 (+) Transcript_12653:55-1008(+)